MPAPRPTTLLKRLESTKDVYAAGTAAEKLALLRQLDKRRFERADDVLRLHEVLCFLRAYPDDADVLEQVEAMLAGFEERPDLRRHAEELVNTGVAGAPIDYRFYWFTAAWLARRFPDELAVDWEEFEHKALLDRRLTRLMAYAENLALDEMELSTQQWVERLKGPDETDAAFLARRFEGLEADSFLRESYYEELDIPCRLWPGESTPARTRALHRRGPVVFQTEPLKRSRDHFPASLRARPLSARRASRAEARDLITLAREAMITRDRDLDVFVHAYEKDVTVMDCGQGLEFACYGMHPERRQMLDAVYGFIILKNGVPAGYVLSASLYGSTELAYNIFETYRGSEAAHVLGHSMSVIRALFESDTYVLDPYQLGHNNMEGLLSGAWWFYYKLGFRPKDAETQALVRDELGRMKRNPRHRSSIDTLQDLSAAYMYLHDGRERRDVIGMISRENIGLHVIKTLSERFGSDRELGVKTCSAEAARTLGVRSLARFSRDERRAWERWAPLLACLRGLDRWSRAEKAALVEVIRAKGGTRESEFVARFDAHKKLRKAILALSRRDPYAS